MVINIGMTSEVFKWKENANGGITITDYTGNGGDVVIPSEFDRRAVTYIGDWAFYGCTGLTSVTIPDSVTEIGDSAFDGCTGLTNVIIPDSVTKIGWDAFSSCTGLTNVTIGKGVTSINDYAFYGCTALSSVTIPDSVTSIGFSAFSGCTGLTSVTIPDSVTSIGFSIFSGCTGLTSINVDSNNKNYISENGVLFNKGKSVLIQYPGGKKGAYIIPDSVTEIDYCAFSGCTGLTNITIPDSVTSIGVCAFDGCGDLTIYGYENSYAETYANENGITFKAIK